MSELKSWSDISTKYEDKPILLGNGFSLNFSQALAYKRLYEHFERTCSAQSKALFQGLQTTNFETVLMNLEITRQVHSILGLDNTLINSGIKEVKQGLIDSINKIHPVPIDIRQDLVKAISAQFKPFSQIFTTNYDLFLYYITINSEKFGDYFFFKYLKDPDNFQQFVEYDRDNRHHIHYLHGALFLFDRHVEILKIIKPDDSKWLLEIITNEINSNRYPLFISEGSSESKFKAINSNKYLYHCWKQLFFAGKGESIVIYGQSLSPQDDHITGLIDARYKHAAISIRATNKSTADLRHERERYTSLFKHTELDFFVAETLFTF